MKKVVFYIHDELWFGHLSRVLKIYKILENFFHVHVLISWHIPIWVLEGINYSILPFVSEIEKHKHKNILLKERKKVLMNYFYDNEVDFFLIDYFPFWRYSFLNEIEELLFFLNWKWCKSYSIMRDIYSGRKNIKIKKYTNLQKNAFEMISKNLSIKNIHDTFYESWNSTYFVNYALEHFLEKELLSWILVFWDKNLYDVSNEFVFLNEELKNKFYYFWMLLEQSEEKIEDSEPYILVCFGGNIFEKKYFFKILSFLGKIHLIKIKVILGTMVKIEEKKQIRKYFSNVKNIELIDHTTSYKSLLNNSKIFIWSWGYGTVCDVISSTSTSFLIPNYNELVSVNLTEQNKRLEILSKIYKNIVKVHKIDRIFFKQVLEHYFSDTINVKHWNKIFNSKLLIQFFHEKK